MVSSLPTISDAGPDQTGAATCGLTSVTLAANAAVVGTGSWSIIGGLGGTITAVNSPTSTFTGVAGTTYVLRWTISNAPCTPSTDDVNITFNQNPTIANAGLDQTGAVMCGVTITTLAGNAPAIGTGIWTIIGGAGGNLTAPNSPTSTFTGVAGTAYTLRWTISHAPCTPSADDVNITFNQTTTTANAGPDQTGASTCGLTTVTLAANTPAAGTGAWTITSGSGGTVTTPTSPTSTFTGVVGTAYTLRWTITNAPCPPSIDDVNITFNALPTPVITGAASACNGTTGSIYSTPLVAGHTYVWAVTGGTITAGAGTNSITVTWNVVGAGTVNVTETITATTCSAAAPQRTVTVNANPTITLGANPAVCAGVTSANLTYSATTGTPNQYSIVYSAAAITAGFVNVTNAVLPVSPITLVVPAAAPAAVYTANLIVTNSVTGCVSTASPISVTVNALPTPVITGAASACNGTTGSIYSTPLVAGHTYVWAVTGGTITAGAGTNSITVTWNVVGAGTVNVTETITATTCSAAAPQRTVTVNANPTITLGANPAVCAGVTSANLTYSATTGTPNQYSIVYSAAAITAGFVNVTNAVLPVSPIALVVPAAAPAAVYTANLIVTNSVTGCVSATSPISVTVNALPTPVITGAASACNGTTGSIYSTPLVAGHTYVWVVTGGTITAGAGTNSITVTWNVVGAGTVNVTETITATTCSAAAPQRTVTVNANPTITLGANPAVCAGVTSANLTYSATTGTPNQYSIVYSAAAITAGFVNVTNAVLPASPITLVVPAAAPAAVYTANLIVTNSVTGCVSATSPISVTVNALPTPVITGAASACNGTTGSIYSTPLVAGHTYVWAVTGGTITAGAGTNSITVTWNVVGAGTVNVTETITATTCSAAAPQRTVTVNANPTITLGANPAVCAGVTSANLTYSATTGTPNQYSIVYSAAAITAGFVNVTNAVLPVSPITLVVPAAAPAAVYTANLIVTNSVTGCVSTTSPISVTVNALPTPVITGAASACNGTTGSIYSTPLVAGHTYVWAVTGGTITAGAGTNSITVTWNVVGAGTVNVTETITATTCSAAAPQRTVTVNANPTITLGANPAVCAGVTSANLTYSATTGTPNQYSIVYSAAAITAGFVNVTNAVLPVSPILL